MEFNTETILSEAYELGMLQNLYEIENVLDFLKTKDIKNFMEIGTNQGGTFICWSKICDPNGIKISLDWANGPWGSSFDVKKRNNKLLEVSNNVQIIEGDSHSMDSYYRVKKLIGNTKLDFLFIDGDHSERGVQLDYFMYKEFVKDGGYIGFHDIKESKFHEEVGCFVNKFWQNIEGKKNWFFSNNDWGGIGLIKKDK